MIYGALANQRFENPIYGCVTASIYMILGGPANTTTGIMGTALKGISVAPLFPTTEPYSGYTASYIHVRDGGGETITFSSASLASSQVVDWVFVELRDKNNPATVVSTKSGLLLASGSVVAQDGSSSLVFSATPKDDYYVAIRHRNHLGCMTATPVNFRTTQSIDFRQVTTAVYGATQSMSRKLVTATLYGLWGGDSNQDGRVIQTSSFSQTGIKSDHEAVIDFLNGTSSKSGYYIQDLNLNGITRLSGGFPSNNEYLLILNNTSAAAGSPASTVQQLP